MNSISTQLFQDEAGFIVSAELILVATIVVLGMVVGLAEVSNGINEELEDVATAFGRVNQSYFVSGFRGHKARTSSSSFTDSPDFCDSEFDIRCDSSRQERGGS